MRTYYQFGGMSDWLKPSFEHTTIKEALQESGLAVSYLYVYDQDKDLLAAIFIGRELRELDSCAHSQREQDYRTWLAKQIDQVVRGHIGRANALQSREAG